MCKPIWRDCAAPPSCISRCRFSCVSRCRCSCVSRCRWQCKNRRSVMCSSSDSMTRGWAKKCSAARGSFSTLGAAGGLGRRGCPVPSTPAPVTRPPHSHRLLQGASERSGYSGEDETLGVGEREDVRWRGEDTMQLGDISVMAWTKRCYLHTR